MMGMAGFEWDMKDGVYDKGWKPIDIEKVKDRSREHMVVTDVEQASARSRRSCQFPILFNKESNNGK